MIEWAIVKAVIVQQEHSCAAHDQHQREDEQQMVVAEQDVLDAVQQEGAGDRERSGSRGDLDPRLGGMDQRRRVLAVLQLYAHQHVGDRRLQSREFDPLASKSAGRFDHAPLDQRIGQLLRVRTGDIAHAFRQREIDRQAHAGEHGGTPDELVALRRRLPDFEIGRARFVRHGIRRANQQRDDERQERP